MPVQYRSAATGMVYSCDWHRPKRPPMHGWRRWTPTLESITVRLRVTTTRDLVSAVASTFGTGSSTGSGYLALQKPLQARTGCSSASSTSARSPQSARLCYHRAANRRPTSRHVAQSFAVASMSMRHGSNRPSGCAPQAANLHPRHLPGSEKSFNVEPNAGPADPASGN